MSSILLAMRAANLDEASFLLSLLLMALRVFVLDQVRMYRGGSVYGAATGPDTSPPWYMLNPVPHGAFATALPPWFVARRY